MSRSKAAELNASDAAAVQTQVRCRIRRAFVRRGQLGKDDHKRERKEVLIIIVMGVAGAGKSTLAKALASALGWILIEGDDYHPISNIEKIVRAEALDDDDRAPWLEHLHRHIADLDGQGASSVVACSALKTSYRTLLSAGIGDVRFVHLYGDTETIAQRMLGRRKHFMPSDLLESQLDALEPPEDAIMVSVDLATEEQADSVLKTIAREQRP